MDASEEATVESYSACQESSQDEIELTLVEANSVDEPQTVATSESAATFAVDGVQNGSDESIVADDETHPLVEPLAAASPIEPQDQHPALDESPSSYPAEPAARKSSPKRFNRLFSKMQSK